MCLPRNLHWHTRHSTENLPALPSALTSYFFLTEVPNPNPGFAGVRGLAHSQQHFERHRSLIFQPKSQSESPTSRSTFSNQCIPLSNLSQLSDEPKQLEQDSCLARRCTCYSITSIAGLRQNHYKRYHICLASKSPAARRPVSVTRQPFNVYYWTIRNWSHTRQIKNQPDFPCESVTI